MRLYEQYINNLNEDDKLTFDDIPVDVPSSFIESKCYYGEKGIAIWLYEYINDKDIYLKYFSNDDFSIGSLNKFRELNYYINNNNLTNFESELNNLSDLLDKDLFSLKKYSSYSDESIIDICETLSNNINRLYNKVMGD